MQHRLMHILNNSWFLLAMALAATFVAALRNDVPGFNTQSLWYFGMEWLFLAALSFIILRIVISFVFKRFINRVND
ncbi:hypothetical protein [Marinococcus sp. PL1-022]|uniref:hypothetical protein n=1 Tax=Marinococcus sp. PL1-022 TaxID=3095363 RepID=UPI0029C4380F|nr:hypothetical protein [Marinococcus sp. PL1-022]MDX6154523.1 hypothetical protein [Marinococcus sp. PL1-022]